MELVTGSFNNVILTYQDKMIYLNARASTDISRNFNPAMATLSPTLKSLRALSDPTRLRIVALLEKDELSVNELQEITRLGQSRISTHLGLLLESELVRSRRDGKRTFYRLESPADGVASEFIRLAIRGAGELPSIPATRST